LLVGFQPVINDGDCQTSNRFAIGQGANRDSSTAEDSLNDGPHVFWQNDSSAIVFYLCNAAVERRTFRGVDTLRFHGFCQDSDIEYVVTADSVAIEPHIIEDVSRIIAVSDIHGEYEHLVDILAKSGVIDDNCCWSWGDGHLVILGDVLDRGDKVTECLWLIRRLESEAKKSGGAVHYLLGNHELMVLRGDNRYVHEKYLNGIARETRIKHQDLYGPDMELGRWLRSKHSVIKVNDIIFVHAGISAFLTDRGLGLTDINETIRNSIDLQSSQLAFDEGVRFLLGNEGPLWYRGYHQEMENRYPMAPRGEVDSILSYYRAKAIVVGHTEVDSVSGIYGNRIMAVDVPAEELGTLEALLWDNGRFYRVTGKGELQPIE